MTDEHRPIEPEMQPLWDNMDALAVALDSVIRDIVGSQRCWTIMVHPKESGHATISTSNTKDNHELIREWLKNIDAGKVLAPPSRIVMHWTVIEEKP